MTSAIPSGVETTRNTATFSSGTAASSPVTRASSRAGIEPPWLTMSTAASSASMAPREGAAHGGVHAVREHLLRLGAGRHAPRIGAVAGPELGVPLLALAARQALEDAERALAQLPVDDELGDAQDRRGRLGGLPRPSEIARMDARDVAPAQQLPEGARLTVSDVVQLDVGVALPAAFAVPRRLAMAGEIENSSHVEKLTPVRRLGEPFVDDGAQGLGEAPARLFR